MDAFVETLKRHQVAIAALLFFTLLCINEVRLGFKLEKTIKLNPGISGIAAGGEGLGLYDLFLGITGGIYFLVNCGYAIVDDKDTKFYLCICLFIIVETITVFNIG